MREFDINGERISSSVDPDKNLLRFLREDLDLTGTKYTCGDGTCGNCSIMMNGTPVNSCMLKVSHIEGKTVTTIEGVADEWEGDELHPVQEAFLHSGAVQCGYCTPGMVLRGKRLLETNPNPSRDDVKNALMSVSCRCTGYNQIIDGVMEASKRIGDD